MEPPNPDTRDRRDRVMPDLEALRAELKALLASWEDAFAMGHGCSVGDHPQHQAVRRRGADRRPLMGEHPHRAGRAGEPP
jgi:hypothetical protein